MGADLDIAELHVSVRDYFTRQPYITSDGQTSLDMACADIEVTDVMYEAKVNEISTAKITLPSLIAFPGLRPLLQQIKEGNRVEIFNFQPDCGDPVFAGFIPPNGIEEQDGKVILTVEDTLGQLKWQHLKRLEYLNAPASGLYDRARSIWQDLVNEDFLGTNPAGDYTVTVTNGTPTVQWGAGFVQVLVGSVASPSVLITPTVLNNSLTPRAGDVYLLEADVVLSSTFAIPSESVSVQPALANIAVPGFRVGAFLSYQYSGSATYPDQQLAGTIVSSPNVSPAHSGGNATNLTSISVPQTHHLTAYLRFNSDGTVTNYCYIDYILVDFTTYAWTYDSTTYTPGLLIEGGTNTGDQAQVTSWRASRLVAALNRAARFNPQTTDAVTYQPNFEENLQWLQLVAEKDGSEYRPLYRSWATSALDDLEVDTAGTLGTYASRVLGYAQPPGLPTEGSPQVSPLPVIMDAANFVNTAPPFRFEEGWNLESPPRIAPRASAHANDVVRVGASTAEAQVFAEKWLASEVGRPQHSPSGATYPRFEQITNDDRVGIQSLVASFAGFELIRRTDSTPSVELMVVDDIWSAFRWRAGDSVFVKTQSLRTNLEQEMRATKVRYKAGQAARTVTVGRADWDPTMLRLIAEDTKISWLYDQSGTNPGVYIYPSSGSILSGATSAVFSIPLDQYTTGSALVYAALHWFADANVMNLQPIINGTGLNLTGMVGASSTDSGLILCTACFQGPGTYQIQFKNNDASTRNLTAAFLVLRIKA